MVPLMNLVIKLDNGNVTGISWDNDCFTCSNTPNCYNKTAVLVNKTDIYTYYDTV